MERDVTRRIVAPPAYDQDRAFYVGLNKARDGIVAGKHKIPDRDYTKKSKASGGMAILPSGPFAMGAAGGSVQSSVTSRELSDSPKGPELRGVAADVFQGKAEQSIETRPDTAYEVGRDYHYRGSARFRIRTHDDFREPGQHETAPRLGLWLFEIPDTVPEHQAESVTWVVLSGTAEGQLKTELGGTVSDWRGGSQTEHLFEQLAAKMAGRERENRDARWLQDPFYALAARSLLSTSHEQTVEALYMCLEVHTCAVSGEDAVVSNLGWTPASTGREVLVSRVILGTPYFVQFPAKTPQGNGDTDRSLLQIFKEFLRRGQ